MANSVDTIIGSEAIKQVENLIAKLNLADAELIKISQSATTASKGISSISTPSGLGKAVEDTNKLNLELERQNNIIKALELEIKKLSYARQNNNKQSAEEAVNQRILNQNAIAQAKSTSNLVGAYQKLDLEHKKAIASAQNLGVQYGTTSNQFKKASNEANKMDAELKKIDATLGKSQRNVGNYQSAFNGLGNALGAFGIIGGVAGVVALGKEIFETTKEIQSLDNALKLVTETQENFGIQQSFLQRISEAYGVELSGLTKQFTQFYVSAKDKISSNEIQGIFESITKAGASMGLSTQQQERAFLALNQMMSKGTIQAEELRGQLGEALPGAFGIMAKAMGVTERQLGQMMKDGRVIASEVLPEFAKQLEKTYGVENVTRVENLTSAQTRLSNSWRNFVKSLDEDGNVLSKFFSKTLGLLSDLVKGTTLLFQSETRKQQDSFKNLREKGYNETVAYYNSMDVLDKDEAKRNKAYLSEKILDFKKEVDYLQGRNLILKNLEGRRFGMSSKEQEKVVANEAEKKANLERIKTLANLSSSYLGQVTAINSILEPQKKVINQNEEEAKSTNKKTEAEKVYAEGTEKWFNQQIAKLKEIQSTTADTNKEYKAFIVQIEALEKALKLLKDGGKFAKPSIGDTSGEAIPSTLIPEKDSSNPNEWMKDYAKDLEDAKKATEALQEATDNFLASFSSEFLQNSGLGSFETFFDGTFKKLLEGATTVEEKFAVTFNAIAESAQEAFNFISNASQANFEAENARVQSQYETALRFAGGSTVAEAKLREDLEKKKKDIANRENKAKQKQALFNIAIDTAQGIVSALASTPPNIPLSIAIGVLGAVQLGLVASQKVPQYFDGTDNHKGGLMLVNDGAGSNFQEKIILPSGKEIMPEGRNVLMNAPAGTKVLTHEQQIMQMLNERGISMNASYAQSNGMTANEMDSVLTKHFANIQTNHTSIDENGFKSWSNKNGNKTINSNNRVRRIGINV